MSNKCEYCTNTFFCKECDKDWKDKFIPKKEIKHFFNWNYIGIRGINGYIWSWNSTHPDLKPTHYVVINNKKYCPYCGEETLCIQDEDLNIIGHCCICDGALAELEFESKKEDMQYRHQIELQELENEYKEKLKFCSDKLLDIKQERERQRLKFFDRTYNHFNTKKEIKFD